MQLKLNNIYMLDCLEGIRSVPSKSIKSIITDPPYFMGMTHNGQKGNFVDLQICKPFYTMLAQEFARVLKDTGEFYIFTDWRGYAFYYPIFAEYLPVKNMIVWDKLNGAGNFYAYTHELIIYGSIDPQINKKGVNIWREKAFSSGAKTTDGEKVHPTQKPVALIQRIIKDSTRGGRYGTRRFYGKRHNRRRRTSHRPELYWLRGQRKEFYYRAKACSRRNNCNSGRACA